MLVAAYFQSQVVLGTDAGQYCQLFAAQTLDATTRAGNQPDVFGPHLLAPRTQIFTQRVGLDSHQSSLNLSPAIPGITVVSQTDRQRPDG